MIIEFQDELRAKEGILTKLVVQALKQAQYLESAKTRDGLAMQIGMEAMIFCECMHGSLEDFIIAQVSHSLSILQTSCDSTSRTWMAYELISGAQPNIYKVFTSHLCMRIFCHMFKIVSWICELLNFFD